MKRLRELDFLRGLAILLVLLRHKHIMVYTTNMGWIGVDLFFVLSGFLVSGLLFKEYLKFGYIKPVRFLIRRGFKIYPIYYIFYLPYLALLLSSGQVQWKSIFYDLIFIQNYMNGWGYAYHASWSLAVEEHFYFGLAILLWIIISNKVFILKDASATGKRKLFPLDILIIGIMVLCFVLRLVSNHYNPMELSKNFSMTHLRIDSLLMGVLISYQYYFKNNYLTEFYNRYKRRFIVIFFAGLCWTPFIEPNTSFFVKTFGFSLLYLSFGILLLAFLIEPQINKMMDKYLGSKIVNLISKIGYCSYSIYIIHTLANILTTKFFSYFGLYSHNYIIFTISSITSILGGMLMTYKVERFFLNIRDKYFPTTI